MFYRKEDIDQGFICGICNNIFVDPRLLPCTESACHDCIRRMIETNPNNEFDCKLCQGEHKPPSSEGFLANGSLSKLLKAKAGHVNRGGKMKELADKVVKIKGKCDEFKLSLDNGVNQVREHCIRLRNQVHLETDILIEEVHKFNESLIAEIDKYEQECVDSFNNKITKEDNEFDKFLVDLTDFRSDKTRYLAEFDVEEEVVEIALLKADSYLKECKVVDRSLKKIQFNGKLAEFIKRQTKIDRALLGTLVYKSVGLENVQSLLLKNDILVSFDKSISLFKCEDGYNYVFYIDTNRHLNMCSFDNDGKIIKQVINALRYQDKDEYSQLIDYKVVQSSNKFIVFVRRQLGYKDGAFCGRKITNDPYFFGLFLAIDRNFTYLGHNFHDHDFFWYKSITHMTANTSAILWVDTDYKYKYLDVNLGVFSTKHLDPITTQVGNTIVDIQMNNEYVFALCNCKKLKIFEIESGDLVKEIETDADQIKLVSVDRLVLFDSANRVVHLYDQSGEFCKLEEDNLAQSLERDLKINRDQSNCLAFYNSTSMRYLS
jgi:hypothetical protein